MPTYKLTLTAPPSITLRYHTFTFRVYQEQIIDGLPVPIAVGQLTFQKPAEETWIACRDRFIATVQAWLATYEQAEAINDAIALWLQTQTWTT